MKFSFRQILASTAGAVVAAIIASTFGVKGTIVGVAIGSAAATMATALVAQSIERGHEAVKQVAVKAPETATLLRKLGGTGSSGDTLATSSAPASSSASSAPTEVVRSGPPDDGNAETVQMESTAAPVGETELEISAVADAPATERLRASTSPMRPAVRRPALAGRFSWRAIAASAAVVFVLALLFITAIELISGKPLSAIFGGSDAGTTLKDLVTPPQAPATTPTTTPSTTTTTTSTTSTSSTTTSTTTGATTTSTTAPAGAATTTTTSPAPATTTTTVGAGATSTTTPSGRATSP